jgi:hypothetical protein
VEAAFPVTAGETVELRLAYSGSFGVHPPDAHPPTIGDTVQAWESWAGTHTGYDGRFPDEVRRSSLILQGLTFAPSGAIVAAATTSLPERLGADLNFDYRFAWPRAVDRRVPRRTESAAGLVLHRRRPHRRRTRADHVRRRR